MTVVSSKEFSTNQEKYFEMALNERIFIKKGNHLFFVTNANEYYDEELEEIMEYRNAKSHKSNAIPFDVAFDEIETFINK